MKRRFLPISLFMTVIVLAQTCFVANAHGDSGKYVPRSTTQATVESFMKSIRANQETGLIDPAWMLDNSTLTQSRDNENLTWVSLGPDNYGSLTKAIVYDKNDATNKTIYIGTMGGGVFKTVNGGITWKTVSENMMVSSMVQTKDGRLFVGTGDGRSAHDQNGLVGLNYSTSFNGSGIYRAESGSENFELLSNTTGWNFVNELATYENTVYAATTEGLFMTTDNGENWTSIIEGIAHNVEVNKTGIVIAYVDNQIYTFNPETNESSVITNNETNMLPSNTSYKVIAASPSNPDYVYVAYIDKNKSDTTTYKTGNIYVTRNFTESPMVWEVAYEVTQLYDMFGSNGLNDHMLAVHPTNPKKVYIGGADLWVAEDKEDTGIYRMEKISSGNGFQISNSGGTYIYNYSYIHTGIQSMAFNPSNASDFFVGSNGGIFKGEYNSSNGYSFEGKNRYFEDADHHTSVARMFSVAPSGNNTVLGGSLDHGTIKIIADSTLNNVCTGNTIFPNDQTSTDASATYGSFNYTMAAGPGAISTINPNAMFVTTTSDFSIGASIYRTQTAGNDYDKENFSYSATNNTPTIYAPGTFRTPIALYECYNDNKAIDSVMFYNTTDSITYNAGDTVIAYSLNADYPFEFVLTEDLLPGDSVKVQDIISSTLLTAARETNTSKIVDIYMTRDALKFSTVAQWWKLGSVSSNPNCITISSDGDVAFVGTIDGKLYRYEGLTDGLTELAVEGKEGTEDKYDYIFDSIPDESKPWDTTFFYNKIIVDSIIDGDTVHTEIIVDTTFILDTVWVKTDVKLDSILTPGEDPIASLIASEEIDGLFNGQAITSISVDPQNNNNVLVTLGNYGNSDYVFYSTDGGSTFNSIQGNLPEMPVYSGIIEKSGNGIIIGTEKGIYTTTDRSTWTFNGLANIPVMDLKQQTVAFHHDQYKYLVDEVGAITTITYPGVTNEGALYAATYGRGLFRCNNFLVEEDNTDLDVQENVMTSDLNISIYPNPIINNATIRLEVDKTNDASYQIYDLSGRMVSRVSLGKLTQGTHNMELNVENLNAGTYIIRVQIGDVTETSKILVY